MTRIPTSTFWKSAQNGDVFGSIIRSKGVDLNEDGKLKLARKAMTIFSYGASASVANGEDPGFQDTVLGMVSDATYAYILTPVSLYVMALMDNQTSVLEALSTNKPAYGFDSDIVTFNGVPHVSGGQYVAALTPGQGTGYSARVISGLSTTVPHPLCPLQNKPFLAVGNGSEVKIYNASYSNTVTVALPSEFYATTIRSRGNDLYIGTRHIYGGEARVFIASGSSTTPEKGGFDCGADWVYSMCNYGSSIAIATSAGQIRRFNGGGFDDIANFPVYYTPYSWASTNANNYILGRIANRGMTSIGDFLYINIDGSLNQGIGVYPGKYLIGQPSGLWEYSPNSGLSHKSGLNFNSRLRFVPTGVNSSYLSFASAHQALTGDPVLASPVTITGITSGQVYYAIVDSGASTTTMRLALSPADAYAERYITLDGTVTTDYFVLDRYEAFGNDYITYPGAVFAFGRTHPSSFFGTEVMFGGGLYDSSVTLNRAALCSLGMGRNRGTFVTPKLYSSSVLDSIQRVMAFFKTLNLDSQSIIIKYKTRDKFGLPTPPCFSGSATWTSTTTFTIDTTLCDFKSVSVGDEISIISGKAAGYTAHINSIDTSTTTYTVTIDETMPVSSGTFDFIAENWTKLSTFTNSNEKNIQAYGQENVGDTSNWVEYKFELRGRDITISSLDLLTNPAK